MKTSLILIPNFYVVRKRTILYELFVSVFLTHRRTRLPVLTFLLRFLVLIEIFFV